MSQHRYPGFLADYGFAAGYVLQKTFEFLGLPPSHIFVHILSKGTNVHSISEIEAAEKFVKDNGIERVVILDQGSRPGPVIRNLPDGLEAVLLIDHHQSDEVGRIRILSAAR